MSDPNPTHASLDITPLPDSPAVERAVRDILLAVERLIEAQYSRPLDELLSETTLGEQLRTCKALLTCSVIWPYVSVFLNLHRGGAARELLRAEGPRPNTVKMQ